ncbi:MAG: sortase [Acidobacteriota bacterium]
MKKASPWLRRIELALCFVGVVLLAGASGETFTRWNYQAQQERALERGPAVSSSPRTQQQSIGVAGNVTVSTPIVAPVIVSPAAPLVSNPIEKSVAEPPVELPEQPVERIVASARRVVKEPDEVEASADRESPAFGRIEIPRLGMTAIVDEGSDEETLARAVGLVRGSAHPGEVGNMVLAGHRDTFFRPLRKIRVNDRIRMIVPPHTYEYEVQSTRVVAPEETSVLDSRGVEELTLVTCYPFRFIGSAPERFIVSARRVH